MTTEGGYLVTFLGIHVSIRSSPGKKGVLGDSCSTLMRWRQGLDWGGECVLFVAFVLQLILSAERKTMFLQDPEAPRISTGLPTTLQQLPRHPHKPQHPSSIQYRTESRTSVTSWPPRISMLLNHLICTSQVLGVHTLPRA